MIAMLPLAGAGRGTSRGTWLKRSGPDKRIALQVQMLRQGVRGNDHHLSHQMAQEDGTWRTKGEVAGSICNLHCSRLCSLL